MISNVELTPLKVIETSGGDVYHALKSSEQSYHGFGEAYFSSVEKGAVKAWKRHRKMVMNLVVPVGEIRFVLFDGERFQQHNLSLDNYHRLTVPPGIWMGFQGMADGLSLLLNIASIKHNPNESDRLPKEDIKFDWRVE